MSTAGTTTDYENRSYRPPSRGLNLCFQNAVVSILFDLYNFFTFYFFCLFVSSFVSSFVFYCDARNGTQGPVHASKHLTTELHHQAPLLIP